MVELAEHRADPSHLEHQPLQALGPGDRIGRDQAAGFLRQIDQDRAAFE